MSRHLAVLGGDPAFPERLHVGRPNLGSRERFLERVGGILDRNWLTNGGPLVREFEQRIAEMVGCAPLHRDVQRDGGARDRDPRARVEGRGSRSGLHLHRHGPRAAVAGDHPGILVISTPTPISSIPPKRSP